MKHLTYLLLLALMLSSCGTPRNLDAFYNKHKDDDQVLAFRVPPVMFYALRGISPEMDSFFGTTTDLRFIQLPAVKTAGLQDMNQQFNQLTSGSFIEIFRKNDGPKRNVVAIRERGKTVRDILIFNNSELKGSLLYIQGNFDPAKVRSMAQEEEFLNLQDKLIQNYSPGQTQ